MVSMEKRLSKTVRNSTAIIVLILSFGIAIFVVGRAFLQKQTEPVAQTASDSSTADKECNIAVVPLVGTLYASEADAKSQTDTDNSDNTSAEQVISQIEEAKNDSSIIGVILRVDSPGGSLVGGERIADALKTLGKPSVAVIWDEGDSAAYLASTGANAIIASAFSEVGDIGVTSSYLDKSGGDIQSGNKFIQIAAGTYKDAGNPDNPLTAAGQAMLQRNVDGDYQTFIKEVAQNRSMTIDAVSTLANGSSFTGSRAMGTGLIDSLGDSETARAWFEQKLGNNSNPVLCE